MSVTLGGNGDNKQKDAGEISPEFAGMTLEEFKRVVTEQFHDVYGRYENTSGTLFFEVYHSERRPEGYPEETGVRWRKGVVGRESEAEDMVVIVPAAMQLYSETVYKGYTRVFKGVTEGDMEKGREKLLVGRSAAARDGLLGLYYRGDSFVRVSEYVKGEYSIERGIYSTVVNEAAHGLSEDALRRTLEELRGEGFARDGEGAEAQDWNPFQAFGIAEEQEELNAGLDFLAEAYADGN